MDLFIITSGINCIKTVGWSYTNIRSVYSYDERLEHTKNTINTIKKYNNNCEIVLLESSEIKKEDEEYLINNVNYYINYKNDEWVDMAFNSKKKGFGEVRQILKYLETNIDTFYKYKRIFKISGRYWLNNNFNLNNFSYENFTFCNVNGTGHISTVLYSLGINNINEYIYILHNCNSFYENQYGSLEDIIKTYIQSPLILLEKIGVEGWVAVTENEFYQI